MGRKIGNPDQDSQLLNPLADRPFRQPKAGKETVLVKAGEQGLGRLGGDGNAGTSHHEAGRIVWRSCHTSWVGPSRCANASAYRFEAFTVRHLVVQIEIVVPFGVAGWWVMLGIVPVASPDRCSKGGATFIGHVAILVTPTSPRAILRAIWIISGEDIGLGCRAGCAPNTAGTPRPTRRKIPQANAADAARTIGNNRIFLNRVINRLPCGFGSLCQEEGNRVLITLG